MQVEDFQGVAADYLQRLKTTGPGLPSLELSKGYVLLKQFQEELDQLSHQREQLVLAEKLFDLEITQFDTLNQVTRDQLCLVLAFRKGTPCKSLLGK